jgi:hypothetical protein
MKSFQSHFKGGNGLWFRLDCALPFLCESETNYPAASGRGIKYSLLIHTPQATGNLPKEIKEFTE